MNAWFVLLYFSLLVIAASMISTIYQESTRRKNEFELKLQIAQLKQSEVVPKMTYEELLKMIRMNIDFYSDNIMIASGILSKDTDEKRSLLFNDVLEEVCIKTHHSLSKQVLDAVCNFVTPDHLSEYIAANARIIIVAKCEAYGRKIIPEQQKEDKAE